MNDPRRGLCVVTPWMEYGMRTIMVQSWVVMHHERGSQDLGLRTQQYGTTQEMESHRFRTLENVLVTVLDLYH